MFWGLLLLFIMWLCLKEFAGFISHGDRTEQLVILIPTFPNMHTSLYIICSNGSFHKRIFSWQSFLNLNFSKWTTHQTVLCCYFLKVCSSEPRIWQPNSGIFSTCVVICISVLYLRLSTSILGCIQNLCNTRLKEHHKSLNGMEISVAESVWKRFADQMQRSFSIILRCTYSA